MRPPKSSGNGNSPKPPKISKILSTVTLGLARHQIEA